MARNMDTTFELDYYSAKGVGGGLEYRYLFGDGTGGEARVYSFFFQPGTWMFNYSDTLIRLFPERFWQDIFIYVGLFSGLVGLFLGFFLRPKRS